MKNKKIHMAILLGLLVGAGSSVCADQVVLGASQDATIFEPNVAQETWTEMRVRWQSDATWGRNHPVVQFDLSGLPSLGAGESFQINSARFGFWAWTVDDDGPGWAAADDFPELAMYYNTSAWSASGGPAPTFDGSVSVNTDSLDPDGGGPGAPLKFTAPDSIAADTAGWLFFDDAISADLVEYWANGLFPNYGIQIQGTGTYTDTSRYLHLSSSEGGVAPQLVVDYDIIPEPATMGLLGVFGAAMLVVRRKFMI